MKNIVQKTLTFIYAIGFLLYFELKEYKRRKKNKRYINGTIGKRNY